MVVKETADDWNKTQSRLRLRYVMPSARLTLREDDVVRLALEFLHNRELHISQLSLERETGVINGSYSDDVLFLRQLILDGQWDDVMDFIQPLEALPAFDSRRFRFCVLRRKYEELLCIKSEAVLLTGSGTNVDNAVEEVVKVLRELEKVCPSKDEYSHLCLLLTLPKLNDHLSYQDWNPSHARVQCFREVLPIVEKFLPSDRKLEMASSKNDRLIQLIIKGILYESCVNFCQAKATGSAESQHQEIQFTKLLDGSVGLGDSDLSLISWLQCVPPDTFSVPFEQRTLNVDVEKLDRPTLETSWTEHMLVTPIKPKTFPHSAMPFTRPRSAADVMSRSLLPAFDGLSQGLLAAGDMSRSSFASFHLTGYKNNKLMNTSVDRLFENDNEDVFLSSSYAEFAHGVAESTPKAVADSKRSSAVSTTTSSPDHRGRESPASISRSSRRDSLVDRPTPAAAVVPSPAPVNGERVDNCDGELMKEFQRQKQRMQDALVAKERQREEIMRQATTAEHQQECSRQTTVGNNTVVVRTTATPPVNGITKPREPIEAAYDIVKPAPHDVDGNGVRPRFVAVTSLEDVQAVRCAEFHPLGKVYAVGSNSKTLRICSYPKLNDLRDEHTTYQPTVLFKRTRHHKGSIYCMAWTPVGDLMATGSNDKTVKLMRFNPDTSNLEGQEVELSMHDGTVRDLCFLEDTSNKSSLLISGGAGDCKIYVTDCATGSPYQALSGHSGHVLSLYNWGGAMFVSGSQDKTVRFWDLRTRGCVNMVTPSTAPGNRGSAVAAICVDPSGRLLVSGHEDSSCVLYDIRGARNVQCFKPHSADVRSIRFSPSAYYLLTAGYDNKLVLTDLQGDLTMPLPSVVVAQHQDKVISGRWHPSEFSFLSTSADKTATLWALPPV